jgi:3-oxoacid CoA-transferase subunit A
MRKLYGSTHAALDGLLRDGMSILVGGFGPCGRPENLLREVLASGVRELTVISADCGVPDYGAGILIAHRRVRRLVAAYVGENPEFTAQYHAGEIELELSPMGTLAERIRCGGAGIAAFYTKTGAGTLAAEGKPTRWFGEDCAVMELGLTADLALVKAHTADMAGNLVFTKTARNFNPVMATAGAVTVAEAERIVACGELDADAIHTPGIYVHRLAQGERYEGRIERRTVRAKILP